MVGQVAPDFQFVDHDFKPFNFSDMKGKICIISSITSLDTPVCEIETRRFNEVAANLSSDIEILVISRDLPFAQKRWCGNTGVDQVRILSDYRDASFGKSYGLLIEESRLLARAVFIVDKAGVVKYFQVVKEIGDEPDYGSVLDALQKLY